MLLNYFQKLAILGLSIFVLSGCSDDLSKNKAETLAIDFAVEEVNNYIQRLERLGTKVNKSNISQIEEQIRNLEIRVVDIKKNNNENYKIKLFVSGEITEKILQVKRTHNVSGLYIFEVEDTFFGHKLVNNSLIKPF
jgi:TolA-binding protein